MLSVGAQSEGGGSVDASLSASSPSPHPQLRAGDSQSKAEMQSIIADMVMHPSFVDSEALLEAKQHAPAVQEQGLDELLQGGRSVVSMSDNELGLVPRAKKRAAEPVKPEPQAFSAACKPTISSVMRVLQTTRPPPKPDEVGGEMPDGSHVGGGGGGEVREGGRRGSDATLRALGLFDRPRMPKSHINYIKVTAKREGIALSPEAVARSSAAAAAGKGGARKPEWVEPTSKPLPGPGATPRGGAPGGGGGAAGAGGAGGAGGAWGVEAGGPHSARRGVGRTGPSQGTGGAMGDAKQQPADIATARQQQQQQQEQQQQQQQAAAAAASPSAFGSEFTVFADAVMAGLQSSAARRGQGSYDPVTGSWLPSSLAPALSATSQRRGSATSTSTSRSSALAEAGGGITGQASRRSSLASRVQGHGRGGEGGSEGSAPHSRAGSRPHTPAHSGGSAGGGAGGGLSLAASPAPSLGSVPAAASAPAAGPASASTAPHQEQQRPAGAGPRGQKRRTLGQSDKEQKRDRFLARLMQQPVGGRGPAAGDLQTELWGPARRFVLQPAPEEGRAGGAAAGAGAGAPPLDPALGAQSVFSAGRRGSGSASNPILGGAAPSPAEQRGGS